MVTLPSRVALAQRLWACLRDDIEGFRGRFSSLAPPQPGLHTYRSQQHGGQRRLHLRIDENGRGVLFVDVTDAIHLNQTAASMAKLALDGIPLARAKTILNRSFGSAHSTQIRSELEHIYQMIAHFRNPADACAPDNACRTCGISSLQRAPLFSTPATAPYKVDIALTYGCNNACAHCYNEPDRLAMPSLAADDWRQVLDKLAHIGVPHIIFTGGEATLHPDLPALIAYANRLGQVVGLNTNGRRLSDLSYAQTLAAAGLNHVQVTLGSSRPEVHNTIMSASAFDQTIRGITNALDSGLHTITNTTLMRRTADHVEEIISFLHRLGIRTFAMNGMIYSGGGFADPEALSEHELAPLLARIRDYAADLGMRFLWYTPTQYCRLSPVELEIGAKRCNAGEYSMCIEPDGAVLPCQSYYVAAGNMLCDPWEHIWNSALFRSFRERVDHPAQAGLPEPCHDCPDLPLCAGGCRIEREARAGRKPGDLAHQQRPGVRAAPTAGFVPVAGMVRAAVRARGGSDSMPASSSSDMTEHRMGVSIEQ